MPSVESVLGLTPYIAVKGAAEAIEFYKKAFGAEELFRLVDPGDGRIGHAELRLGGALLMLSDEYPEAGSLGPKTVGGSPVKLHLYVSDVDATFALALANGAAEVRPVEDQFFGDRVGTLTDPFGHAWMLATRVTEVSPEEMQRQWNAGAEG